MLKLNSAENCFVSSLRGFLSTDHSRKLEGATEFAKNLIQNQVCTKSEIIAKNSMVHKSINIDFWKKIF